MSNWDGFYLNIELVDENAKMPTRATSSDAGCDIYAPLSFTVPARGDFLMPTGWRYEMPDGYVMEIAEKSGVATKKKLDLGARICDSAYRGISHIHFFSNNDEDVHFDKGDKVAQFLIKKVWTGQPQQVTSVNMNTERGEGGFGSSGK